MSNSESNRPTLRTASFQFLDYAWKICIGVSVVVTLLSSVSNFEFAKSHPLLICSSIVISTIILSLLYLIYKLVTEGLADKQPLILANELVTIVNALYEEKKYLDVVRFGSTVSRYLWINGNNKERIAIGELVEDAASKEGRIAEQVSALIDDIGWTYYIVGDNIKATTNISNGIEKAAENGLFYFAAKGERHLSGIAKHSGKISDFTQHLANAETYTTKILDSSDKNEMDASLHLAKAKYAFETDKLNDAEADAKKAMEIFKNDMERIVKVHSLLGNIYLKQGKTIPAKIQKAKDEFNKGYLSCKDIRKDEFAKNAVGLAKIAYEEGEIKTYIKYLNEAREVYVAHHKSKEVNEIDLMLKSIKT